MSKKHLMLLCCCCWSSFSAMASTIEYTPDEDWLPAKSWYTAKDWYPTKPEHPVNASPVKKNHWWNRHATAAPVHEASAQGSSAKSRSWSYRRSRSVQTVTPLRVMPPEKIKPLVSIPFPARIAPPEENKYPWSITGSVGYTQFQQAGDSSGGALLGRFAIGKALYRTSHSLFGLELGVQNGNRMSIAASQATLDQMGSLPIWTTVKPMVDLLGTLQVGSERHAAFLIFKGGIAYRTWESERQSINNLSQLAGEVQAGIGMPIVKNATLSLLYQGVFGANNAFTVYPDSSAHLSNIPIQNGVLLSLSLLL